MRVMFAVYAAKTHFYNMVPLAWALRAAGHEVCVATQPDIVDAVAATGLPVATVGDEAEGIGDAFAGRAEFAAVDEANLAVAPECVEQRERVHLVHRLPD